MTVSKKTEPPEESDLVTNFKKEKEKRAAGGPATPAPKRPTMSELTSTLDALQYENFPALHWSIPGILPEGCTILAGKPKVGKTWAAQDMALAVATGGEFMGRKCEQGDVLYLALEDNKRRFQSRMTMMYGHANKWPKNFTYATEWPTLDDGCIEYISEWIAKAQNPRLIVIDIIENVKPVNDRRNGKDPAYRIDYNAVAPFRKLAAEHHLAVLPLHHQRKMGSEDLMDTLSGTLGLTGGTDNVIVLGMERDGSKGRFLWGKGRDLDEFNFKVEQGENRRFRNLGTKDIEEEATTPQQKRVLAVLRAAARPLSVMEIATRSGMLEPATKQILLRLHKAEIISRPEAGHYAALQQSMPMEGGAGEKPSKPKPKKPGHNANKVL